MPGKGLPPYHIGEQHAAALLPPVTDTLAELEQRLSQYVDRLRLSEADRQKLDEARGIIARARGSLDLILAAAETR